MTKNDLLWSTSVYIEDFQAALWLWIYPFLLFSFQYRPKRIFC